MSTIAHRNALQAGYELHWYQIKRVLGQGAFGITYLSHDINLERLVAIKEYMPSQLSVRENDMSVQPLSGEHDEDFKWGLERFLSEARTLTKFEHPNLVRVFNVFEANNTAYMIMNYEVGDSLKQILKSRKTLSEPELIGVMLPLMSGLELMHKKGFIHRDIKPGNIFIRYDGTPVLLDFGSARQTRGKEEPQTLTNFVSPGYAPIEQYSSKSDRQGPWTDIYGLGATLYKTITGIMPIAAIDRNQAFVHELEDDFIQASQLAKDRYSKNFLAAVDHALAFKSQDRPQSIAEWRNEFNIEIDATARISTPLTAAGDSLDEPTVQLEQLHGPTVNLSKQPPKQPSQEQDTVNISAPGVTNDAPSQTTISLEQSPDPTLKLHEIPTQKIHQDTIRMPDRQDAVDDEAATEIASTDPLRGPAPISPDTLIYADPRQKFIVTAFTVVTIIILVVVADLINKKSLQPATEPPAVAAAVTSAPPTQGDAAVARVEPAPVDAKPGKQAPEAKPIENVKKRSRKEVQIDKLLILAGRDLKALKLTKPKGNSAYEKYRKVLALDKTNKQAKRGIKSISGKYVQFAYSAIKTNRFKRARHYLKMATKVSPGAQEIIKARMSLQAKMDQQRLAAQTNNIAAKEAAKEQHAADKKQKSGIGKWFSIFSRKDDPKDENAGDRVKRVLGGS